MASGKLTDYPNPMFNLEPAIAEWRRQMIAGGIESGPTLDELESHLREETERQRRNGASHQEAFAAATRRIGNPDLLKSEFKKVGRAAIIVERIMVGIGSIVIGFGLFLSAVMIYLCLAGWIDRIVGSAAVMCS